MTCKEECGCLEWLIHGGMIDRWRRKPSQIPDLLWLTNYPARYGRVQDSTISSSCQHARTWTRTCFSRPQSVVLYDIDFGIFPISRSFLAWCDRKIFIWWVPRCTVYTSTFALACASRWHWIGLMMCAIHHNKGSTSEATNNKKSRQKESTAPGGLFTFFRN